MEVLITDVTEMGAGNYCVAGWNAASGRMIRPLPNGGNWAGGLLNNVGVAPGVTIDVTPLNIAGGGAFPHLTEDTLIDPASAHVVNPGPAAWFGAGAPPTASTVQGAFHGNVQHTSVWNGSLQGVHVAAGTNTRSLWAVEVDRGDLDFVQEFGKLKAQLDDGQYTYVISVSSRVLKEAFRAGGVAAVDGLMPANGRLHVRIGLARPWQAQPSGLSSVHDEDPSTRGRRAKDSATASRIAPITFAFSRMK